MMNCCNGCDKRFIGCHAECDKYKLYKIWYNMRKKKLTPILSHGRFIYNKDMEYYLRYKSKHQK